MRNLMVLAAVSGMAWGQMGPTPAPQNVPAPGAMTDKAYAPTAILPGGVVIPLYPAGSPFLKSDRVREPEKWNMNAVVAGRVNSIVNIHNPSIEVHLVDRAINTGAAVILAAGGGHRTLNVGGEAADFVPFFLQLRRQYGDLCGIGCAAMVMSRRWMR